MNNVPLNKQRSRNAGGVTPGLLGACLNQSNGYLGAGMYTFTVGNIGIKYSRLLDLEHPEVRTPL